MVLPCCTSRAPWRCLPGCALRIRVEGLDTLHAALAATRYGYARPGIEAAPCGERSVTATDPFGNRLVFFEPDPSSPQAASDALAAPRAQPVLQAGHRPGAGVPDEVVQALVERLEAPRRSAGSAAACRSARWMPASCNGCELEINALQNVVYDLERFGLRFVASPRHADVLLVTGPLTRNMREALERTPGLHAGARWVVAAGDCAVDGGVFKGSYGVEGGIGDGAAGGPGDPRLPADARRSCWKACWRCWRRRPGRPAVRHARCSPRRIEAEPPGAASARVGSRKPLQVIDEARKLLRSDDSM